MKSTTLYAIRLNIIQFVSSILQLQLLRRLYVVLNIKQFRGNEVLDVLQCTVDLERKLDSSLPDITLDFVLVFHQHVKL